MAFRDELLAENASGGSITGVTAGAGLSGGGTSGTVTVNVGAGAGIAVGADTVAIADGGVTTAKLSPTGGANGKVLKHNGTAVVWGDDQAGGLTLPYAGTGSSGEALFKLSNAGAGPAVLGESTSHGGVGVEGYTGVSASAAVFGHTMGTNSLGLKGESRNGTGVVGMSEAAGQYGVWGKNWVGYGAYGVSTSADYSGVGGENTSGAGVSGKSSTGNGVQGESGKWGVYGKGGSTKWGVLGTPNEAVAGISGTGANGSAGYFDGKVQVTGTISKGGGSFKIDHPLDPEHRYLSHSFVESPDMKNIYDGTVVTDDRGFATVTLPEWFDALNRDFRYQLTVLGGGDDWVHARVAAEISDNAFRIQTSAPLTKVSWQVTGIRKDPFAEQNRIPVEEVKPDAEQGSYLHPAAYGQPEERSVTWARDPAMMRQLKESQAKAAQGPQ